MAMNWISEKQGEEVRATIIRMIGKANGAKKDIHRSLIAKELNVTRSTAGKHVDRLIEEGKVREVNGRMLELVPTKAEKKPAPRKRAAAKKPAVKPAAKKTAAKKVTS